MTLDISQLSEQISARFPDLIQVVEGVIRFTKKVGQRSYAVYYLDLTQNLPISLEALTKYQDRVIGSHYFEGSKSLQWSNYLYFITTKERLASGELSRAKALIERDRSYARKFVIPEDEIDSVLTPPVVAPSQVFPHVGILSEWTKYLIEAGLDQAILSSDDLPTRIRLIEDSSKSPAAKLKGFKHNIIDDSNVFISSLLLNKYRKFPIQRRFEFGAVNLIFGANGSGKTSLLEAIELFYCGRTKRNPSRSDMYDFTLAMANGKTELVNSNRDLQAFRDRNLAWYGQPEIRTNNLYHSFAQFNFLNTDAAVGLMDSTSRIEDDLSKLLVGPEASEVWRNIVRVADEVTKKLSSLRLLDSQIKEELVNIDIQLKLTSEVREESDTIFDRLKEMIHRIGWRNEGDKETLANSTVKLLSEFAPLLKKATTYDWITSPISIDGLFEYCHDTKSVIEMAEFYFKKIISLEDEEKRIINVINANKRASELMYQLELYIGVDLPNKVAACSKEQAIFAKLSNWLAGLDANLDVNLLNALSNSDQDTLVAALYETAISNHFTAEKLLTNAKIEYENFRKLRDQSLSLVHQLREIAAKILQENPNPDECPLCHTKFEKHELVKHIHFGVDKNHEDFDHLMFLKMREHENAFLNTKNMELALQWIVIFLERVELAPHNMSVRSALAELENAKKSLEKAKNQLQILNAEIASLELSGFSMTKLEYIEDQLRKLGYSFNFYSKKDVALLLSDIDKGTRVSSEILETHRKELDKIKQELEKILGNNDYAHYPPKARLSLLKEEFAKTEILRDKLGYFFSSYPWPRDQPLAKFAVEAESIREVASDLLIVLAREKQAKITYTESVTRKGELEKKLADLHPRIHRLSKALFVLNEIKDEHSLNKAMETALQESRAAIETIFRQIHSPAEFSGLGSSWSTLIRKLDGQEAKLTEISTGQRAAFALSIFLAQNAQLKKAPPVILIDDPIAYIDDMNALSFLDYLREVALSDQRQIFFATANDKLAALFERKFDFLGAERFRRINLERF